MIKKLIKIILIFCFFCITTLILLEVVSRYIIKQPYYSFPKGYFVSNQFYGYELAKNFKGTYAQPEFTIAIDTNSEGLRDIDHVSGKGEFKILALGDSFAFGNGVELSETYLSMLEHMLNNNPKGQKFSIIKAGVVGYSTYNEKVYLEKQGLKYHPDMVMVQFWWDDLGVDQITYLADTGFLTTGKIRSNAQLRLFLNRYFRSYALMRRVFTVISKKSLFACRITKTSESQSSLNAKFAVTLREFKEIEALCGGSNISCLFILIPPKELVYANKALQLQWQSFCDFLNNNNIQYLDTLPALSKAISRGEPVYFRIDPHLNKTGHKILAEEIYQYLFKKFSKT